MFGHSFSVGPGVKLLEGNLLEQLVRNAKRLLTVNT